MPDGKHFTATPRGKPTIVTYAASTMALIDVLKSAIAMLVEAHGGALGEWFDEFEAEAIKKAKGLRPEGISIEDDADAVQFAADTVKALMDATRHKFGK